MARLEAVSADMGAGYGKAIADARAAGSLTAQVCIDPFHVVKLANEAIDACRRWAWNEAHRNGQAGAVWVKRTRWALVKDPGDLSTAQRLTLAELRRSGSVLYRAWRSRRPFGTCTASGPSAPPTNSSTGGWGGRVGRGSRRSSSCREPFGLTERGSGAETG